MRAEAQTTSCKKREFTTCCLLHNIFVVNPNVKSHTAALRFILFASTIQVPNPNFQRFFDKLICIEPKLVHANRSQHQLFFLCSKEPKLWTMSFCCWLIKSSCGHTSCTDRLPAIRDVTLQKAPKTIALTNLRD